MKTYHAFLSILALAMGMFVCGSSPVLAVPVEWDGGAGTSSWNDADNWDPNGVPNDTDDVTISGVATVDLDLGPDATIKSLVVEQGATLNVVAHILKIDSTGGLEVKSTTADKSIINVLNGSTIDVMAGPVTIGPNGKYQTSAVACPEASELKAASITIVKGPFCVPAGEMILDCTMKVTCTGNFKMDGSGGSPCAGISLAGGLTPPIINIRGDATTDIDGDLSLLNAADVTLDSTAGLTLSAAPGLGAGARILLAGDFKNESVEPGLFKAMNGAMELDGTGAQTFEVAGALFDSPTKIFENNFAFGSLTVGLRDISPDKVVTFQDAFDNVPGGTGPLEFEWFFVNGLTLENVSVTVARCGVAFDALDAAPDADVTVKGEGAFTSVASLFSKVPTASQWGVVAIALVLLAAATIGIGRYRRAAA